MNKWFGVILIFLLLFSSSISLAENAADIKLNSYINDYANVFTAQEEQELYAKLDTLKQQGAAEFAIVTIPSLEDRDIEGYSLELAQGKLGDSEKNNGLLLLIAVEDREYRFEVGRGLEPILNDARVGRIGREELVPAFREQAYGIGTIRAVDKVTEYIKIGPEPEPTPEEKRNVLLGKIIFFTFIFMIIGAFITAKMVWRNHAPRKWKDNDYFNAALGAALLGGRRGGGGGFGGFGGGGFSGGGAGGSW